MRITIGTAKWTENLSERASDRRRTARHAIIYLGLGLAGAFSLATNPAWAASDVVISQVYGGGGRSGAPFKQDFIELFNRGSMATPLSGWTVQYASATGNTWRATPLSGILPPGQYLLIELARGNRGGLDLPAPDIKGSLSLASKSGKVALVNSIAALTCSTPFLPNPSILDLVGYGSANNFEGVGAATHLSTSTAALRKEGGCVDTDNSTADFAIGVPTPRNRASPLHLCPPNSAMHIHTIQGTGHLSPFKGQAVSALEGVVTATRSKGFYMQDPLPDADPATSEGIFVFTSSTPSVNVGDRVRVSGTVEEFRPGGEGGVNNLTITEISSPTVQVITSGNALSVPVMIGGGGRVPPNKMIEDDAVGSVETSGSFDADTDGIDFYESLEGMRVQINNAVAVGPTSNFGEIPVVGDLGARATTRTVRGGIVIAADDFNPERVFLDDALTPLPEVNVGDKFTRVEGVLDYSFGNFKLLPTVPVTTLTGGLIPETTAATATDQLSVASFNVENLDPQDAPDKFRRLAEQIVHNLKSPDILGLMEVQDNNGAVNDGVVDANVTFNRLISAIPAAGGPGYQFRSIDPVDDQDGGEPGGNIRVGFLFNPARVTFVDRPGGSSTSTTTVVGGAQGPALSASPGRLDPLNPAFTRSRKPLVSEFLFDDHTLFIIANHFNSKGGDQPLFGHHQPPARPSETQRRQQAQVVSDFVQAILARDSNANVVVLGDLNDFEFSDTLGILKSAGLTDIVETLPPEERYTYVFEGNSQVLDHILISPNLVQNAAVEYDVVHVNAEFAEQVSDHDPEVARIRF
jgi:uncharacterized protein